MTDQEKYKILGDKTEDAFRTMLDQAGIPYLPFCSNINKFSPVLRDFFETKRPDVMVLLRYLGFILIDVKHKKITKQHPDFLFDFKEAEKYSHFREEFGHEVWYAVSNSDEGFKEWYLIPSLQVQKNHKEIDTKNGDKCFIVSPSDCIKITSFKDFLMKIFDLNVS